MACLQIVIADYSRIVLHIVEHPAYQMLINHRVHIIKIIDGIVTLKMVPAVKQYHVILPDCISKAVGISAYRSEG